MRTVPEWIGKTDDTPVPPRVRLRVWNKAEGFCDECKRKILAGEQWQCDHRIAIINGGDNRESNLRVLCDWCHKGKTKEDTATKSKDYQRRAKHVGIRPKKGRPLPGSKASGWKRKMDGSWERR